MAVRYKTSPIENGTHPNRNLTDWEINTYIPVE
jgi:hypothetical protein